MNSILGWDMQGAVGSVNSVNFSLIQIRIRVFGLFTDRFSDMGLFLFFFGAWILDGDE